MHQRIAYTDPWLELLDCIEDAVQLCAFDYFAAARDELRRADRLLKMSLRQWEGEEAQIARAWLAKACEPQTGSSDARRAHYAGTLWRARRAVRRYWLRQQGVAWDPYPEALTRPWSMSEIRVVATGADAPRSASAGTDADTQRGGAPNSRVSR
ncbi:hypothetical protein [Tahibacter amnicola]|uniref:Uncharacterized protein n=1 Tax=Tahibacter amnicola TaxID=2976241 RepID=A0ABY6BEW1_9GAMM|nr:hypothetical protein [Tahibacter amnicola]UXI68573.1 hypothetical protein N4264_02650 [Tahibacter amnicola]